MLKKIQVLNHSSIKINRKKVIYIDPFKIEKEYKDADIIFITHSHYDHFSEEDIKKVKREETKICVTKDLEEKVFNLGFEKQNILIVEPNSKYMIDEIEIETIDDKKLSVKVPSGTQVGERLRVRGHGMPSVRRAGGFGDLYVVIDIKIPTKLNDKQKKLLNEFAGIKSDKKSWF